jgi:hypothetical protein
MHAAAISEFLLGPLVFFPQFFDSLPDGKLY